MRKWWPLVAICMGTFMLLVDVTIVNVALPDMANSLDTSFSALEWVINAYALTLAAFLLASGSLSDRWGHLRICVIGLIVFAVASLVCGLAPNAEVLIAARAVQGVGAAAMFATTFALINSAYSGKDRGIAYGTWGAVSGAAAAIGPVVGGILTEALNWRWIFLVNLPICIAAVALSLLVLNSGDGRRGPRLDVPGTLTFTVSITALIVALIRTSAEGWGSFSVWGLLVVSAITFYAFILIQGRSDHAMVDLHIFKSRSFIGVLIAALLVNFVAFSALTYTSLWLQSVKGLSPLETGYTSLPLSLAAFVTSAAIGRVLHHRSPGPIIGVGMLLIGAGGVLTTVLLDSSSSWPALMPGSILIGVGVGLAIPTLSSATMSAVAHDRAGMASGVVNTARQLGFALGIAVLGSLFVASARRSLEGSTAKDPHALAEAVSSGQAHAVVAQSGSDHSAIAALIQSASATAVDNVFLLSGVLGLVAGVLVLVMVRPAKLQVTASESPRVAVAD